MLEHSTTPSMQHHSKLHFIDTLQNYRIELSRRLPEKVVWIVDSNIPVTYYFPRQQDVVITLKLDSEKDKSYITVKEIIKQFSNFGVSRNSTVIAVGGGMLTDIVGFTCNIYMRGIKNMIFVPTSLMAMIDAAIGGKNGINYDNIKNMIGTFKEPTSIHICPELLKSIGSGDIAIDSSEILKYLILAQLSIFDAPFKQKAIRELSKFLLDTNAKYPSMECIKYCIKIKMWFVDKDFDDTLGIREALNLGHTFGHAIELTLCGIHQHGLAIWFGLDIMWRCSKMICPDISKKFKHIDSILKAFNASAKIRFEKILPFSIFTNKIDYDKKQHFIVPTINKHEEQVIEKISFADMQKYIEQIYNK